MGWTWRYESTDGATVSPAGAPDPGSFPAQGDAESWIGESWQELLSSGVDQVSLFEDDRLVYGPMSLHPAG